MTDSALRLKTVIFGVHVSFLGYAVDLHILLVGAVVSLSDLLPNVRTGRDHRTVACRTTAG